MATRLEISAELKALTGFTNVYYQTPPSTGMKYPAIRYSRNGIGNTFADDSVYIQDNSWEVIVIDTKPDNPAIDKLSKRPKARWVRHYVADNLHHDVFILY